MNKNSKRILFIIAYFSYSSIYIARMNLTVASPVMQEQQLISASYIGMMGGAFFLLYSAGQLVNGYIGDIIQPKVMVITGLFLTAISNLLIGGFLEKRYIVLIWGINGFAQSMLWGPLLRCISQHFSNERKPFIASFLVSSVGIGSVLGVFLATIAIHYYNIRYAFLIPGFIALLALAVVFFFFHPAPQKHTVQSKSLTALFTPNLLFLLIPAMFHGVLKDNINLWAADYFMKTFSVDLVTMAFYVFAIPLLSLFGRLLYPLVFRHCRRQEHLVSIFSLSLTTISLIPLCFTKISMIPAAVCLCIAAAAISIVNTSFLSIYPMRYQNCGGVSKVVGLMDFATYLGAGISSSIYGIFLETHTYSNMYFSWIILTILAIIILVMIYKKERTSYERKSNLDIN